MASNRAYCLALAKVERTWLLALKAIVFPADTAADAKLLIRYDAAEEAYLWACAKASSRAEWNHSWNLMLKASDKMFEVSELVKLDLGLVR
jgi:hypothetical protein